MTVPAIGSQVYLKSVLTNVHIFGVVSDGETPDQVTATLEIAGENATLTLDALVGPEGPAGQNAFALRLQKSIIDDPEDLPTNLTDDDQDVGKYWVMNQYDKINEVQLVTVTGGTAGSSYRLVYNGQTTNSIAYNATATDIELALLGLSNIGIADTVVEGSAGTFTVEFQGTKAGLGQPQMSAITAAPAGGTAPTVTVTTLQEGETNLLGSRAYIWFGDHYRILMMGSEGPVGPVPNVTFGIDMLDPDGDTDTYLTQTGTSLNPSVKIHLKAPRGPQGPATNISSAPDVDLSSPPTIGQVLGFAGNYTASGTPIWEPVSVGAIIPRPYTVPEAAFTNYEGLSTRAPIGSFAIPPQDFAWKPIVWGKIKAFGLELDSDPLIIGSEVRLGNPTTGQLIARGFGNTSNWAHLSPHTSTTSDPTAAITPDNEYALVPAHHTGNAGTIYVNLYNDGLTGVYLFNKANAQLFVMVVPV